MCYGLCEEIGVCAVSRGGVGPKVAHFPRGKGRASREGGVKTKMTKVTLKKGIYSYLLCFVSIFILFILSTFFNALFGRFVTRGVQKHEIFSKKSIWAHHKKCGFFPLRFSPPSLSCFVRFFLIAFFGVL
jgi:hypothetical protein